MMFFRPGMFFAKGKLYNLLSNQKEENDELKKEIAELRTIAGEKIETQQNLKPCSKPECKACVYSTRFRDKDGGYAVLCTKGAECRNFIPWKGI